MGSDTSSKSSALIRPEGRDLSRHWRFTVLAAIAGGILPSDYVAPSGQKAACNVPPECDGIEWIVVGKAAQSSHIRPQGVASRAGADDISRRDFYSIHGIAQKHGAHFGGVRL